MRPFQAKLAEKAGFSTQYIGMIELSRRSLPYRAEARFNA